MWRRFISCDRRPAPSFWRTGRWCGIDGLPELENAASPVQHSWSTLRTEEQFYLSADSYHGRGHNRAASRLVPAITLGEMAAYATFTASLTCSITLSPEQRGSRLLPTRVGRERHWLYPRDISCPGCDKPVSRVRPHRCVHGRWAQGCLDRLHRAGYRPGGDPRHANNRIQPDRVFGQT